MYRKQLAEMRKTNGRSAQFHDPHERKKAPVPPARFSFQLAEECVSVTSRYLSAAAA
jgi:hypothetical protein